MGVRINLRMRVESGERIDMQVLRDMGGRLSISGELLAFLWRRKMWWMIPMVTVLLLMGLLIVFGSTSGVGPFIYTLF